MKLDLVQMAVLAAPVLFIASRRGRAFLDLAVRAFVEPVGPLSGFLAAGSRLTLFLGSCLVLSAILDVAWRPSLNPKAQLAIYGLYALVPLGVLWVVTVRPMLLCWKLSGMVVRTSRR